MDMEVVMNMMSEESRLGSPTAMGNAISSPPSPPTPPPVSAAAVVSPCAACKILRRRCAEKCVLAPYFPPSDPLKFTIAHKVFGASNIIKLLQELPESQRADAVSSMVYEAKARVRDPVYGSAGAICQLQRQVSELQAELAKAQAEILSMQCQQANLLAMLRSVDDMIINSTNIFGEDQIIPNLISSSPTSPVVLLQHDDDDDVSHELFQSSLLDHGVHFNYYAPDQPLWT